LKMVDLSSSLCKRLPEGNAPIFQTQQVIWVTSMDIQVLPRLREGLLHLMYREQRAGIGQPNPSGKPHMTGNGWKTT
jgi:hypothetical protein